MADNSAAAAKRLKQEEEWKAEKRQEQAARYLNPSNQPETQSY